MGAGASAVSRGLFTLTEQEIDKITPVGSLVTRMELEKLRDMQIQSYQMREEIAKYDSAFLRGQMRKRWKQHAVIIRRITRKSKQQLHRLKLNYGSPKESGGQGRGDIVSDIREMLGGPYGEFVRSVFLSWLDNAVEYIECAVSGIGCDDTMIIDVLCLGNSGELAGLSQFIGPMNANNHPVVNLRKLLGKTRKGSCFQLFMMRALEGDRPHEGPLSVNSRSAIKQASVIHEALHNKSSPDYAAFFDVICAASREQCGKISDEYMLLHNVPLSSVVKANFQGSIQRAVNMWIAPRADAFAMALHHALTTTAYNDMESAMHAIAHIVGCVDKRDASTWMCNRYEAIYNEKLADKISSKVNGKLRDALLGWIDEESYDSHLEIEIEQLVVSHGGDINEEEKISTKAMTPLVMLWTFQNILYFRNILSVSLFGNVVYSFEGKDINECEQCERGSQVA
jgi:hypothetical protein